MYIIIHEFWPHVLTTMYVDAVSKITCYQLYFYTLHLTPPSFWDHTPPQLSVNQYILHKIVKFYMKFDSQENH